MTLGLEAAARREGDNACGPVVTANLLADAHFHVCEGWRTRLPEPAYSPRRRVELVLEAMADSCPEDLLIVPGDVVDRGEVAGYSHFDSLAAQLFRGDCYYVPGNHDRPGPMSDSLNMGPRQDMLVDGKKLSYVVRRGNFHLIFLDGSVEDPAYAEVGPIGREWLAHALSRVNPGERACVFCHFPPAAFSSFLPERMVLADGVDVHKVLVNARAPMCAYFYGHIHYAVTHRLDGVLYRSLTPASVPLAFPNSGKPESDPAAAIGFERLRLYADGTFDCTQTAVDVTDSLR